MNLGTIMDTDLLKVSLRGRGGGPLGEIEEGFAATLSPGDTFLFAGQVVRFEGLHEMTVEVTRRPGATPRIAAYMGTKFSTSTQLSHRILRMFRQESWPEMPRATAEWLSLQREVSHLPREDRLLVESFPWEGREYTCIYGFAGRNAMQTLGLLVTQRMEMQGLHPLGFVSTDYAVLIWSLERVAEAAALFDARDLRETFETWLAGNAVMKRTFKQVATIAGLIPRTTSTAQRRTARAQTISADILYDTLRRYDPGHLLLNITAEEAQRGLVDFGRVEEMLARTGARVDHVVLDRVTPLAEPLFLEHGRVPVDGQGAERLLEEEARRLMHEAGLDVSGDARLTRPLPAAPARPARPRRPAPHLRGPTGRR
jgi:ATP-dependent Lhr-like helicase